MEEELKKEEIKSVDAVVESESDFLLEEDLIPIKEGLSPKSGLKRGRPRLNKPVKVKGPRGRPRKTEAQKAEDAARRAAAKEAEAARRAKHEEMVAKNLAAGLTAGGRIDKSKLPEEVRLAEVVSHDEFLPDRVVNARTMYARKLHGIVYDPNNPESFSRMKKHIRAFFALQMNEQEVSDAMNVRLDVLRSWLKRFPELQKSKEYGMMDLKADLMNATFRRAMGYDYYEECATRLGPQRVLKHQPGDPRLLQWLDCNIFKGKLAHMVDQQQASSINIQIVNSERDA